MQNKYGFSESSTGMLVTVPYLVSGLSMIPFGLIGDAFGMRQTIINFGGLFMLATFLLFQWMPSSYTQHWLTVLPWFLLGIN